MYRNPSWKDFRNWIFPLCLVAFVAAGMLSCGNDTFRQGEILYANFCSNCHMPDGSGLKGNIPPLAGSDYVKNDPAGMACVIRYGLADSILVNGKPYGQPMAGIPQLSDFEIANIINYINHSWGNDFGYVQIGEIRKALETCTNEK